MTTRNPHEPVGGWRNHEQWRAMRRPVKTGPSFPTSCTHKVPRNQRDQATAAHLSAAFRAGDIYAYSYEAGQWHTWATEADWNTTDRTPHGTYQPTVFDPATITVTRPKRPTKAEAIALLKAIYDNGDWQVSDLEHLLAREAA